MKTQAIQDFISVGELLADLQCSYSSDASNMWLFRGNDTSILERSMLAELKRRSGLVIKDSLSTDWD